MENEIGEAGSPTKTVLPFASNLSSHGGGVHISLDIFSKFRVSFLGKTLARLKQEIRIVHPSEAQGPLQKRKQKDQRRQEKGGRGMKCHLPQPGIHCHSAGLYWICIRTGRR